jgi:uncharacterized membrane protein
MVTKFKNEKGLYESRTRSILKALSWRVAGSIATFLVAWYVSKDLALGGKIGGMEFSVKFLAFYYHERIWTCIDIG